MFTGRQLLASAGYLSLAIALLHLGIILVGAPAYRFFGGADLARLAAEG